MKFYVLFFAVVAIGAAATYIAARRWRNSALPWIILAGAAAVMGVLMWTHSQPDAVLSDFKKAYYAAGQIIRDDPDLLYRDEPLLFVNIPIVAWLFAPISLIDVDTALVVMTVMGVVAIVASLLALIRTLVLTNDQALLLAGAFAISGPMYYSLREGNTTHFVLLALVGMMWCVKVGAFGWAGLLLAAATIIKPPLALIALPFLLRRQWDFVGVFAGAGIVVLAGSLALYGIEMHRDWYDYAVRPYSQHPLAAGNVQSLDGVLARLWTGGDLDDFTPVRSLGLPFRVIRTALAGILFVVAALVCWRARSAGGFMGTMMDASIALCLALLIAPTSWTHYYLLLLLPVALIIAGGLRAPWTGPRVAVVVAAVLLISPTVTYLASQSASTDWMIRHIIVSHYFFGGLLMLGMLLEARWRAGSKPQVVPSDERAVPAKVLVAAATTR